MAEDPNNAADAAAGATTPAPAEPAASVQTEQPKMPDISDDPWAGFGEEKEPDKTEVEAKSDEPDGKEIEKKEGEEDPEDQIVKEAFGAEEPEKKADEKKPDEGKPTEEDIDKQDPKEMIASQRNATAKAWAERAERVYKPTVDYKYGNLPVADFHDRQLHRRCAGRTANRDQGP